MCATLEVTTDKATDDAAHLPRRVLIAEDEHFVATNLADHLVAMGVEVVGPASNGKLAIELAKQNTVDLALLDIRMPEMNGIETAGVLFGQMGIPVVIVSAFPDPQYVESGARIGVFGYMLKPVTFDELRANLTVAWSRYRQHSELREQVRDLKQSLEDRKVVERAKGLLMERRKLSEDQAMKMLQRQARNTRRKLVDLARAVLETEELLND